MKNIGLRIFSLIVATMLAYYVHSDTNEGVAGISVPVELKGLPSDMVVIYPLVRQAQVSLKGPSFLLSQIYASPPAFKVKVPEKVENRFVAQLNRNDLSLPPAVKLMRVEPSEMEFTFDRIVKKDVPVQVTQIGAPPDGIKLADISAKPKSVTVTGPQTEIKDLNRVDTEPIDLREITSDVEKELPLRLQARQSELSEAAVMVKVSVSSIQAERVFEEVPVEVRSIIQDGGIIEPSAVRVKIIGPKERVNSMRKEEVVPYVKIQSEPGKNEEFRVLLDLPKPFTVLLIEPEKVKVVREKTAAKKN